MFSLTLSRPEGRYSSQRQLSSKSDMILIVSLSGQDLGIRSKDFLDIRHEVGG